MQPGPEKEDPLPTIRPEKPFSKQFSEKLRMSSLGSNSV